MIQVGDTRRVAQADGRGFSKLGMEESGSESRPPVASARMENGEYSIYSNINIIQAISQNRAIASPQSHQILFVQVADFEQRGKSKHKKADKETLEVVCRLTPYNGCNPCLILVDENTVECCPPNGVLQRNGQPYANKVYEFGRVFDETDTQKDVFERCSVDLIEHLITGRNALLFTYGVTGSGKTHTMTGSSNRNQCGILPRTLDTIFNSIQDSVVDKCVFYPTGKGNTFNIRAKRDAREEVRRLRVNSEIEADDDRFIETKKVDGYNDDYACALFVSYVEIYNNYCYDLLDNGPMDQSPPSLDVHMDANQMVYVGKLKEVEVSNADEALQLLKQGDNRRKVCDTLLNKESSRSHSVFTIRLVMAPSEEEELYPVQDASRIIVGQLSLVDLAGSERAKRTLNTGDRLNEAAKINQSLMTLRQCFEKLRKNQRRVLQESVPYRDTKLTYLFKNFFEGAGKVRMIICANPRPDDYEENQNVLSFAEESQSVETKKDVGRMETHNQAGIICRPPVPRKFYAGWNHEIDRCRPPFNMTPLEVFPWEDVKRGNDDVCMLREYSRRKGDETGDDNILTLLNGLGEGLRSRLCVSDYEGSIMEELKVKEEELNERRTSDAALIKKLKRENASLRSRLLVYEEDNEDRVEMEREMRRVKEEEKERLRRHRGRVEKTLEIANGVTPSVATLTNKFNEKKEMMEYIESDRQTLRERKDKRDGMMVDRNGYYDPKYHRRSQSASRVLDHQPVYRIPTGNILRPKMPTNSKSTTNPLMIELKSSSAYVLTHQEVDKDGAVSTSLIKGECIPTAGGGTAVCFSDIERLSHQSPTKSTTRL
ncbi:zen-4 [Pristionchus pacificus]|uniref:Kinesin-like protein n=1 Tax=Pristionchus pacificus TaxID=54126 RepID=A0A2A6BYG4_PRIPA|nr:zen-4 [Pristionchus pacificus]|eukprot:PDM70955.1 zen-4 [Pristionchus pacificus]